MCRVDFQNSDGCCGIGAESTDEFIGTPTCICRALGDNPNNPTTRGCCRATGSNNTSCICLEKGENSTACACATDPSSQDCFCKKNPRSVACLCARDPDSKSCRCAKNPNLIMCQSPLTIHLKGKCINGNKRFHTTRGVENIPLAATADSIVADIDFMTVQPDGKKRLNRLVVYFPLKIVGITREPNRRHTKAIYYGAETKTFQSAGPRISVDGFPRVKSIHSIVWKQNIPSGTADVYKNLKKINKGLNLFMGTHLHGLKYGGTDRARKNKKAYKLNGRNLTFDIEFAAQDRGVEDKTCPGYQSPLMVFFNEKRPHFKNTSNLLLSDTPTYWPEKNHPGFLLAIDIDNDNKITKSSEIFGNTDGFKNGFERLKLVDSNKDNLIDRRDKVFSKLVLWKDKNGNGIGEKSELIPLKEKGVLSISLNNSPPRIKQYGKRAEEREVSVFSYRDKKGKVRKNKIIDIWFSPVLETRTLAKTDNKESPHEVNKNKFYKKGVPF